MKRTTEPLERMCQTEDARNLRALLGKVGEKWTIVLLVMLSRAPGGRARFSELQKRMDGISQRVLTATLRNLERDGLVTREVFPEVPPRVEYEMTALGRSLLEPMDHLGRWSNANWRHIEEARTRFDRQWPTPARKG